MNSFQKWVPFVSMTILDPSAWFTSNYQIFHRSVSRLAFHISKYGTLIRHSLALLYAATSNASRRVSPENPLALAASINS